MTETQRMLFDATVKIYLETSKPYMVDGIVPNPETHQTLLNNAMDLAVDALNTVLIQWVEKGSDDQPIIMNEAETIYLMKDEDDRTDIEVQEDEELLERQRR